MPNELVHTFESTEQRDEFVDRLFPTRRAAGSPPGWYDIPGEGQARRERANGGGNLAVFCERVTFIGPAADLARRELGV